MKFTLNECTNLGHFIYTNVKYKKYRSVRLVTNISHDPQHVICKRANKNVCEDRYYNRTRHHLVLANLQSRCWICSVFLFHRFWSEWFPLKIPNLHAECFSNNNIKSTSKVLFMHTDGRCDKAVKNLLYKAGCTRTISGMLFRVLRPVVGLVYFG